MAKGIIQIMTGIIISVIIFVAEIEFDQNCGGYLKQAADANTAELALKRLVVGACQPAPSGDSEQRN